MIKSLSLDHWCIILSRLAKDSSLNMFSLSNSLRISYAQVFLIVRLLESKGFVKSMIQGRTRVITVTPAGLDVVRDVDALALKIGVKL